jgi:hypothetical protein
VISQQYRPHSKAPAAMPGRSLVERMADVMREMRAAGQVVTAATLAVHGDFTDAEVAKHAMEASNIARSRETRQVAQAIETLQDVLSGLALTAFLLAGNLWLIGVFS